MIASDSPAPDRGDTSKQRFDLESPGSPYVQAGVNAAASNGRVTSVLASQERSLPPKTKNELRQIEYIRKLSLQRQRQVMMPDRNMCRCWSGWALDGGGMNMTAK